MKAKSNNKKRIWLYVLTPMLAIIAILAYYQLLYQPQKVDSALMKLGRIFKGHQDIVTAVRFNPNDSLVITSGVDSTIKIWKSETGEIVRTIRQPQGIAYLDLSTDGNYIATGSYDEIARVWRVGDGTLIKQLKGHRETIWTVAFSTECAGCCFQS